jgi:hypothetical protein
MKETVFTGCIPALMTPCTPDRRPDFDALVRKGRELIQAGMSALVYCGSMGDWPLLSDAQRKAWSGWWAPGDRVDPSVRSISMLWKVQSGASSA